MPTKKTPDKDSKSLGDALRWLRHERRLTQDEVVERVQANQGSLSKIYYSMVERGLNKPKPETLGSILGALESNEGELAAVIATPPWGSDGYRESTPHYRMTRESPKPLMLSGAPSGTTESGSELAVLSSDEKRLLYGFRELDEQQRINVLALVRSARRK